MVAPACSNAEVSERHDCVERIRREENEKMRREENKLEKKEMKIRGVFFFHLKLYYQCRTNGLI
jgi:hypothetical protein